MRTLCKIAANTADAIFGRQRNRRAVPREPFGFGGWNDSCFGASNITG
jgi:hypothetical protein